MKTRRRSLVLGAVLLAGVPAAAVAGPLCAGAARVDITPPLAMFR